MTCPLLFTPVMLLDDTYEIIKEAGVGPRGGIMHSYSGSLEMAERFIDLGMMISFSGVVTFKKALDVQEAAQHLPLDKILVETDAPILLLYSNVAVKIILPILAML